MSHERDDIGVDARLRRALASAPDAQVEPPAALDEAILRAAHAALPRPSAAPKSRGPARLLAWLKRWWAHPAAAPVFAVLALSTVIVSMWTRHGVPSPTTEADAPSVAAAPEAEPARPMAVGGADAAITSAAPAAAATPAAPAANARVAELRSSASPDEQKARSDPKEIAPAAALPAAAPPTSPSANALRRDGADPRTLADKKAERAPPTNEFALRARQEPPTAQRDATAGASGPADGRAPAPAAVAKSSTAGSVASNVDQAVPAASSRAASTLTQMAAPDAPPLARAFDAAAPWRWRPDRSQPPVAIDDGARAWFAQLEAAAQGRWVHADRAAAQAPPSSDARVFELWREQAPWATIVVASSDVTWLDASGRAWRATLAPDALAALRNW